MNYQRRKVTQAIIALFFSDNVSAIGHQEARINELLNNQDNFQGVLGECLEVYRHWLAVEGDSPKAFFDALNANAQSDAQWIRKEIQRDFEVNRLLTVQGMVISKTEAVILARIGEGVVDKGNQFVWHQNSPSKRLV
jgi:hypothetical protein